MSDSIEKYIQEQRELYEAFSIKFDEIKRRYIDKKDVKETRKELQKLASDYSKCYHAWCDFLEYGCDIFDKGETEQGFKILQIGLNSFENAHADTGIHLRFVQYYMENENPEKAEEYLLKICLEISNYDESIEWSGVSAIWEKYRYLVEGKIPPPLSAMSSVIKSPDECTKDIKEILELPKDDLLADLSEHLSEMSGGGEEIVYLNKWEKAYFDVDAILMEVGSGGVDSWLHMCGHRFEQTKKALQTIRAEKGYRFIEEIEKRFPKGKVPKSYERLEKILDKMIDNDEDFEEEENRYYWDEDVEAELVDCLYQFVMDNKKRFR